MSSIEELSPRFDFAEGERQRDKAIRLVGMAAEPWTQYAVKVIADVASARFDFTSDDVWAALDAKPNEPRALGAAMKTAATRGIIYPTGEYRKSARPECHARPVAVWRARL
jgi:hypothetical protein